jgi:putative serine protease PepD
MPQAISTTHLRRSHLVTASPEPAPPRSSQRGWIPWAGGVLAALVVGAVALGYGPIHGATVVKAGAASTTGAAAASVKNPGAARNVTGTSSGGITPPAGKAPALDLRAVLRAAEPGVVDITDFGPSTGGTSPGRATGEGSGMVLDTAGHVLTNAHVVSGATTVSVQVLGQSKLYRAKVLGVDRTDDVAVVQIQNPGPLTPVTLGNSSSVQVGDPVVAIGNALGLAPGGPSVTSGIISALGRSLSTDNGTGGTESLTDLIQTDAPINPGNSGGPLVDAQGQVIAMNTAISTSAQNIGFAIPIDRITPLIGPLENGTVPPSIQGFLGVSLQTPASGSGARIMTVQAGSPAASAGLQVGDVITAVNGQTVATGPEAAGDIQVLTAGTRVTLTIVRAGATQTVTATLGSKPPPSTTPAG